MIVHGIVVREEQDPPDAIVMLRGTLEEVREVAHLVGERLEITMTKAPGPEPEVTDDPS